MSDAAQKMAAIDAFSWSDSECDAVIAAMCSPDPWDHDADELAAFTLVLKSLKVRIATLHLGLQGDKCCYCRTLLKGGGRFIIDREHILPKSRYRHFTYDPFNLSVSCKRCNLEFKGQSVKFLADPKFVATDYQDPGSYLFVHPNCDTYRDHLSRFMLQSDDGELVKYTIKNGSAKGSFTHQFFDLQGLEINSFDEAQGQASVDEAQDIMRAEFDKSQ